MEFLRPSSLFHLFTVTLLGLLLPLSFVLLARLATAQYVAALPPNAAAAPPSVFISLLLNAIPALLYLLVSSVTVSALFHALTGKSPLPNKLPDPIPQPRLYCAWILLCSLQVCVGVGVEGSLSIGLIDTSSSTVEGGLWSRLLFFVGLHETVVYWSRVVVKPVVDDTVFGEARKERWSEKVATAVSFGGWWWWRLRDEAEALVVVADFPGWCLYYITVAVGVIKIIKSLAWIARVLLSCQMKSKSSPAICDVQDKV